MVETIYQTTNEKIEEKTRKFFIIYRVSSPLLALLNIGVSISQYVSSGYSFDSIQLLYPSW